MDAYTDPLPQALVLTAIVISFGMTAVVVMIGLGAYLSSQDDHINETEGSPTATKKRKDADRDPLDDPSRGAAGDDGGLHRAGDTQQIPFLQRVFSLGGAVALLVIAAGLFARAADGTIAIYQLGTGPRPSASCWCSTGCRP